MATDSQLDKLAVILHADVAESTRLVQLDEHLAHQRFQQAFNLFGDHISRYRGRVLELRGDALVAEFERASDAVAATLSFQADHTGFIASLDDDLKPEIRVGIALGEVVIANNTVTGAGVVLAQRVEQLSDKGGICISSAVHEALPKRMPFDLENMGEHDLKGFDEPVRVYRVKLSPDASIPPPKQEKQSRSWNVNRHVKAIIALAGVAILGLSVYLSIQQSFKPEIPLPDKPSIVVLPFYNLGDDRQQEYFADGMTGDLITDLSKVSGLFVIARNTSFSYKGKTVEVQQIAEELGVRYVLEGNVRRFEDQIRINAQMIDATTGGHLWAERYDGILSDVFELQDQVVDHIVSALEIKLTNKERSRLARIPTQNLEAYDYYQRAEYGFRSFSGEGRREALSLYGRAVALDPQFADAYAGIARAATYVWRWDEHQVLPGPVALKVAYGAARKALALDPENAMAYSALAQLQVADGQYDAALESIETAVSLHPNNADIYTELAGILVFAGQHAEALTAIRTAFRLEPKPPPEYYTDLGWIQFWNRNYEQAIEPLEKGLASNVELWSLYAMAYAMVDRPRDADAMLNKLYLEFPSASLAYYRASSQFKLSEDTEHLVEALQKAGMPEWPLGFEAPVGERLDVANIENLTFGQTWVGSDITEGGSFAMEFDKEGGVTFRGPKALLVGTAWIEDKKLCLDYPGLGSTSKSCSFLYQNLEGTVANRNEYILIGQTQILSFSIKP